VSWAKFWIQKLKAGETVSFRPRGNSMTGRIESGQLVTVSPDVSSLSVGDVVLCTVRGMHYLHLITGIRDNVGKKQFQISNNHNRVNGWTSLEKVYGKLISVSD
jgi:hypothetical protein